MKKIAILLFFVLLILESSGQTAEIYLKKGNEKYKASELEEAINYYTKAIEINTNFTEAYLNRAKAELGSLKFAEALKDYDITIKLSPEGYPEAYFNKALLISLISRNDKTGLQLYNKAIELNPKYIEAYYWRGKTKDNLEDYQGAITDFLKVIELNQTYEDIHLTIGQVKVKLKDYEGAATDFNKAIEINPKSAKAYYSRGVLIASKELQQGTHIS